MCSYFMYVNVICTFYECQSYSPIADFRMQIEKMYEEDGALVCNECWDYTKDDFIPVCIEQLGVVCESTK